MSKSRREKLHHCHLKCCYDNQDSLKHSIFKTLTTNYMTKCLAVIYANLKIDE